MLCYFFVQEYTHTAVENAQTSFVYWQAAMGGSAAPVDAFGHLLGGTDGNNVSTVMAYDAATGAPTGISSGIGQSSAVQLLTYQWDGYGNLEWRKDDNQSLTETFNYDDLNRLTGSTVTNSAANGPTLGFGYDAVGDAHGCASAARGRKPRAANILTKTVSGTTESYSYDPNHPYAVDSVTNVNGGTYTATYDSDGNMVTRNGEPITWTTDDVYGCTSAAGGRKPGAANLPASISSSTGSSTFNYDPGDQRYYQAATLNGVNTDTTYVGSLFEVVASSTNGNEFRHNILADGQVVAVHDVQGSTSVAGGRKPGATTITSTGVPSTDYLHYDHLGSVNVITDTSGAVIQSMSFDAFGNRRLANNWDYGVSQNTLATLKNYTDRGYTSEEELDSVSLMDLNGRVYDPCRNQQMQTR